MAGEDGSRSDNNGELEAEKGKGTSVYETFMDVSSIFSNPILSFGGGGQGVQQRGLRTRSRFFDDVEDEDEAAFSDPQSPQ